MQIRWHHLEIDRDRSSILRVYGISGVSLLYYIGIHKATQFNWNDNIPFVWKFKKIRKDLWEKGSYE